MWQLAGPAAAPRARRPASGRRVQLSRAPAPDPTRLWPEDPAPRPRGQAGRGLLPGLQVFDAG